MKWLWRVLFIDNNEFLVVLEYGAGKVVFIADEWPFLQRNGSGYDINYGSNLQMVENIWTWLLE